MAEKRYEPQKIEAKWQTIWEREREFEVGEDRSKPKFYALEMLPYPSGDIHMGHTRNYSIVDAVARYKRMRGFNVLHPIGWDAFGLPAENAAIKHNTHPETWTRNCIANMKRQLRRLGYSYAWDREIATCDAEYYRWNQWFFIKMFERGLAYRGKSQVNWCPRCQTTLANEQVVGGCCWRHDDTLVDIRELEQWFLKTTNYAEELNEFLGKLTGFPERTLLMQQNWIGRSEGAFVDYAVADSSETIRIFTTRIDTIYGCTFMVLAPEHPMVETLIVPLPNREETRRAVQRMLQQKKADRTYIEKEKEGIFTGRYAFHPFTKEKIPIWIANFVLMEYGTGAVECVPAHDQRDFEFAHKYQLPRKLVVQNADKNLVLEKMDAAYEGEGTVVNSGAFSGLETPRAREVMTQFAEKNGFGGKTISYRIKDWGISRQRYWGTPIPMIYCDACGIVAEKEDRLPVLLPNIRQFTGTGGSPLSQVPEFVNTKCPKCGHSARRETDTMDTFVDSSWYFFRYCDPRNDHAPFEEKKIAHWFPIDLYVGGIEHAILHLIYSRFWTKVMRDMELVKVDEPIRRLFHQGMVLKDGVVMSKSRGNIVDPDDIIEHYGADTGRVFVLYAAPPEKELDWSDTGIDGPYRFLQRLFRIVARRQDLLRGASFPSGAATLAESERYLRRKCHQTIKRVTEEFETRLHMNTAVAALMEFLNAVYDFDAQAGETPKATASAVLKESVVSLVKLVYPFAPHLGEELWEMLGHSQRLTFESWPEFSPELAAEEEIEMVIQINGKVRGRVMIRAGVTEEEARELALNHEKIKAWMDGKTVVKTIVVPNRLVNIVLK